MNIDECGNRTPLLQMLAMVGMAMVFLFACGMGQMGSKPAPELSVVVLSAGTQGNDTRQGPTAEWVASHEELEQLVSDQKAGQLPAQGVTPALDVDFTASRILLVRMGQKPTAGYSLKLDRESCRISQQTAYISLIWTEPDPGMVAAQVITRPFILLQLSKGGYDSVNVVDQHERTLFDLPLAE